MICRQVGNSPAAMTCCEGRRESLPRGGILFHAYFLKGNGGPSGGRIGPPAQQEHSGGREDGRTKKEPAEAGSIQDFGSFRRRPSSC